MKKKNKILTIISSIFGVFAICGLSLFSLLDHKKEPQVASAIVGDVMIEQGNFNNTLSWNSSNNDYTGVTSIVFSGSYTYFVRNTGTVDVVYLKFNIYYTFNFYEPFNEELVVLTPSVNSFESNEVQVSQDNNSHVFTCKMGLTRTFAWTQPFLSFVNLSDGANAVVVGNTENLDFEPSGYPILVGNTVPNAVLFSINYSGEIPSYQSSWQEGWDVGYQQGYSSGNSEGLDVGYQSGYTDGVNSQQDSISNAYSQGYSDGYSLGSTTDSTVGTIFSKIFLVAMLPVDFFLRILNWEILGVNIASFISALLSVAATVIVIRLVTGKKE